MDPVQMAYEMFVGLVRAGHSPEQAEFALLEHFRDQDAARAGVERYHLIAQELITAREPEVLADRRLVPWYTGPRPGDTFWPALREALEASGWGSEALSSLELASTKVLAHMPPPWKREFSGRGLVLGYVQSGKTSNYTAVAAKAADAGYRLVIVLAGIHNNLRRQTQQRLDQQLVELNTNRWLKLTDEVADFGRPGNADPLLSQNELRLLAVVKKNKRRLQNLVEWLESASPDALRNCPILVIDDEADQASINTKSSDDRAAINELVVRLLAQPKIAYVGYTATPFANIFVDPSIKQDLYPRDFIVDLPRPASYFGPERIFGREPIAEEEHETGALDGLDVVRYIPDHEVADLRPPRRRAERELWDPEVTDSLREAVRYFLLVTAARRARGHIDQHSSMLIHTTQYADLHHRYRDPLIGEIATARGELARGLDGNLRELWERERERVPAESVGETPVAWEDLRPHLDGVLDDARVIVDNYLSDERLEYGETPQVVIAIGGNTLSRGLTLEGLAVSFFLRTASAYDTILQMGRWFGFRPGYGDLPRIWTTRELAEYFQFLATVEAEIRTDIARYEKEQLDPTQFAVRVRTHPQLAITSALKMQAAVDCEVSYSGRRLQTILFDHRNRELLKANQQAARRLVAKAGAFDQLSNGNHVAKGVDVSSVLEFIDSYAFHQDSQDLDSTRIRRYVEAQNRYGDLLQWNVAVIGRTDARWGTFDFGGGLGEVGLLNRAAVASGGRPHANIKSLMSKPDRVVDLDLPLAEIKNRTDADLQSMRPPSRGLILLYPVNKDSRPQNREGREPLDAVEHVIGVGLVFPDATRQDTTVRYKSVALPLGDVDEMEELDAEALDTEAELDEVQV